MACSATLVFGNLFPLNYAARICGILFSACQFSLNSIRDVHGESENIKHDILICGIRPFNYLGEGRQRLFWGQKNRHIFDLFAKYLVFYDLEIEGAFFSVGRGRDF